MAYIGRVDDDVPSKTCRDSCSASGSETYIGTPHSKLQKRFDFANTWAGGGNR